MDNEAHKKRIRAQYEKSVQPCAYNEGDLLLTYDQRYEKLGKGKFESMWYSPFVIAKVLEKGAYELMDYDGIRLGQPRNGLYINISSLAEVCGSSSTTSLSDRI